MAVLAISIIEGVADKLKIFIYLFHSFTTTKEIGKQNHTAEELAELRISVVEGLLHTDM